MSVITPYKTIGVVTPEPLAAGGQLLNDNFRILADADEVNADATATVATDLDTVETTVSTHVSQLANLHLSQAANRVWASPSGATGVPLWRTLVTADIPALPQSKITDLTTDLSTLSNNLVDHIAQDGSSGPPPHGATASGTEYTLVARDVNGSFEANEINASQFIGGGAGITGLTAAQVSAVPTDRTVSTTSPLAGGGSLASNLTLAMPAATTSVNGYLTSTDWTTFNGKTPTSRTISTTSPLAGGGDLSANLTLSIAAATGSTAGSMSAANYNLINGATDANTALTLVQRNASGNFTAGTITSTIIGVGGSTGPLIRSSSSVTQIRNHENTTFGDFKCAAATFTNVLTTSFTAAEIVTDMFSSDAVGVGFNGAGPVEKQTVTGSRDDGTALANLLTALDTCGVITNSSSA